MLSGNQESPAAPAEQYDTLATLPAETKKLDAMDLLIRKITQLRDLCNTCSNGDDSVAGVFWFMSDTLQCCDRLATEAFKAVAAAGRTAPDAPVDQTTPETSFVGIPSGYIAIPEAVYNDLTLTLEALSAQLLIASDSEFYQTNIESTITTFALSMQREVARTMAAVSDCSRVRGPRHD